MSKKRSHPLEAVIVASTGQAFEWTHTRCRFSPEIILDKVPLNWCRISYIHMIHINVSRPCFGASPIRRCCCWPSEGSSQKVAKERNRFIISSWFDMSARQDMGEVSVNHPKSLHPKKGYHSPYHPTGGNRKMRNIDTLKVQSTKQSGWSLG